MSMEQMNKVEELELRVANLELLVKTLHAIQQCRTDHELKQAQERLEALRRPRGKDEG